MKNNLVQKAVIGSLSLSLMMVSSGLSMDQKASANAASPSDPKQTIKVLYGEGSEAAFQKNYGDLFSKKYPNADFEVITPENGTLNYDKLIAAHSPDLVMLTPYEYQQMAKEKELVDLEPLMERDEYDAAGLYPGLIDELKRQGGGNLYGLSKSVQSNAVLYNVDLFKKYNVELPKDGMSWGEILKIAGKFPTTGDKDLRIWGLSSFGSSNLAMHIARTEGLTAVDPATMKVTANTPAWEKAYKLSSEATQSGVLDEGISLSAKNYLESSPFVMGRSAMVVSSVSQLKNLQAAKSGMKNYKPFELGIAAAPANSKDGKSTGDFYTGDILAIPAKASNVDGAWDFIEYFTGDEYAKQYYSTKSAQNIKLQSRMVKEYAGHPVDAFYQLKPNLDQHLNAQSLSLKSAGLESKFWSVLQKEIMLVVNKKKTVSEAANDIQSQVQAAAGKLVKAQK